jgi:death-on-curing protein
LPSGKKHYRITIADALSAHQRALETGGITGIPNLGMVESAIGRPYQGYYRPIYKKAAALVESVARNHGFADGNKRTALILVYTLIRESGFSLVPADDGEALDKAGEDMVLAVVKDRMSFDDLTEWFKKRIVRL